MLSFYYYRYNIAIISLYYRYIIGLLSFYYRRIIVILAFYYRLSFYYHFLIILSLCYLLYKVLKYPKVNVCIKTRVAMNIRLLLLLPNIKSLFGRISKNKRKK